MRKLSWVMGVLLLAGCATQKATFDANQAAAYLAGHPDRPAPIRSALASGKVCRGMNEAEVRLCWGKPDKVVTMDVSGQPRVAWVYYRESTRFTSSTSRRAWVRTLEVCREVHFIKGMVLAWQAISP